MNRKILCKIAMTFLVASIFTVFASAQNTRSVKKQILISNDTPKIKIKFDKKFKFVGSQKFVLYNRADAEQFFFVDADNQKINRLYMLQFENYLPKIDAIYNYNEPQSVKIGGLDYFSNTEIVPDVKAALGAVSDSDIAKAAAFLQSKNFIQMKSLLYQRFVRVVSDDKRSEFIILYIENADGIDAEATKSDLQNRAMTSFKIIK